MPPRAVFLVQIDVSDAHCWVVHFHQPAASPADYWLEVSPLALTGQPVDAAADVLARLYLAKGPPSHQQIGWLGAWHGSRQALRALAPERFPG